MTDFVTYTVKNNNQKLVHSTQKNVHDGIAQKFIQKYIKFQTSTKISR